MIHAGMKFQTEVSLVLYIQRGAAVSVKVTRKYCRRGQLVQGGSEVPCEISIRMPAGIVNHTLLQRYETLLRELYTEPKEEEVMGTFLSGLEANAINFFVEPHQKNDRKNQKPITVRSKCIKQMFTAIKQQGKPSNTIVTE